jgi:hypothetical protein
MAFSRHTTIASSEPPAGKTVILHPDWNERIVTVVAVGFAVLVVAVVAVLMGMS